MWLFFGVGGAACQKDVFLFKVCLPTFRLLSDGSGCVVKKARCLFLSACPLPLLWTLSLLAPQKTLSVNLLNVCGFHIISWPWKSCTRLHAEDCVSAPAESSTDRRKFLCVFILVRRNVTRDAPAVEWCGLLSGIQRAGGTVFSPDVT